LAGIVAYPGAYQKDKTAKKWGGELFCYYVRSLPMR